MSTKEIIGHIDCPVCGRDMPIKADRNGHAYGHCIYGCTRQLFTRNDHCDKLLRARMRPVTVSVTEPEPATVAVPAVSETVPAPAPAPKQKAGWFQPLMGAKHGSA